MKQITLIIPLLVLCLALPGTTTTFAQDAPRPVITTENAAQVELLSVMGVDRVYDLDWSPDGEHLAVFSRNQAAVYNPTDLNTPTPNMLQYDPCRESQYPCRGTVTFTDDGETLLVGSGYTIHAYDVPTFAPLATYETELDTSVLLYSQAFGLLVHGGGPPNIVTIALRDFDAGAAHEEPQQIYLFGDTDLRGVMFEEGPASGIALSPDGHTLAVANGLFMLSQQYLYSASPATFAYDLQGLFDQLDEHNVPTTYALSNEEDPFQIPLEGDSSGNTKVVFSPDGSMLVGAGTDGRVSLWSMPDGTLVDTLDAHYNTVWDITFSPDGTRLVTAGGG